MAGNSVNKTLEHYLFSESRKRLSYVTKDRAE